jgi:hypothetical protein
VDAAPGFVGQRQPNFVDFLVPELRLEQEPRGRRAVAPVHQADHLEGPAAENIHPAPGLGSPEIAPLDHLAGPGQLRHRRWDQWVHQDPLLLNLLGQHRQANAQANL